MKRRALLVGIDRCDVLPALTACSLDARAMAAILAEHHDGTPNYSIELPC